MTSGTSVRRRSQRANSANQSAKFDEYVNSGHISLKTFAVVTGAQIAGEKREHNHNGNRKDFF